MRALGAAPACFFGFCAGASRVGSAEGSLGDAEADGAPDTMGTSADASTGDGAARSALGAARGAPFITRETQ
jgi:hypothetical protein